MVVKAVEMIRKIRDQHYEKTKNLSIEEQMKFINDKSIQLQKVLDYGTGKEGGFENDP